MPTSYLRVQVTDTHRATQIQHELLTSKIIIEALMQESWFLALRDINRRWECAEYNQDGEHWVVVPLNSPDNEAVEKLNRLFPGLLSIETIEV